MHRSIGNDAAASDIPNPIGRPQWLRRRVAASPRGELIRRELADLGLATVCHEACCPNQSDCYSRGALTFLILGRVCTRCCRYCGILSGRPKPIRDDEPQAVAEACRHLGLRHVVITSVTRDDLADGGASQFARTIKAVRRRCPGATIEVLTPDFGGKTASWDTVLDASPDVLNHNIETVQRLYRQVRPEANYHRSLELLAYAKRRSLRRGSTLYIKSGLMVGLGETDDEVSETIADIRGTGCDILTIGQYLSPSPAHHPVARFVDPDRYARWRHVARSVGFKAVAAGPFVRSSYGAGELLRSAVNPCHKNE